MLLLDGHKIRKANNILSKCTELWNRALNLNPSINQSLVYYCRNKVDNSWELFLDRHDDLYDQKKDECIYWASYLAKVNTKDNTKYRNFGSSRVSCLKNNN